MLHFFKSSKERFKNIGKEGILILLLIVGAFVACQGAQDDGNIPFGPSNSNVRILPSAVNVAQAGNVTFTTLGGTAPFTWSSANIAIGAIVVDTGYSSMYYHQALKRLDRPGQARTPIFYHVGARDTVDVDIAKALAGKKRLEDAVMERLNVRRYANS